MEQELRRIVARELIRMGSSASFAVEWPADITHGDYAINAALAASKELGTPPRDIAVALTSVLATELGDKAASVEIAGPGFINITLSANTLSSDTDFILSEKEIWGTTSSGNGQSVMVEYGNPNPFKEMHIGHLVGTVIGESLARLMESVGTHVIRDTFGGDVGPQVAKALWVLQKKGTTDIANAEEIGRAYTQGSMAYEQSEEAKTAIDELNTRIYALVGSQNEVHIMSEEDRTLLYLWQKGREVSMEEFNSIFTLLGTTFDYTFFDSDTTGPGMNAVQDALAAGILEESEGAVVYKGERKGLHTLVFVTGRGTPTYETKDIGLAFLKEMRSPTDRVIVLTAVEQAGHFKVVLAALEEIAPKLAQKTEHATHGLLQLTTGKMSSRKGNVITARELIKNLVEMAGKRNEDPIIAEQVAVGALKYLILRSAPGNNIIFDPEKSLSLDGDSGPYLQYALVRARSILEKAPPTSGSTPYTKPYTLARLIHRFPGVVEKAERLRGPHILVQYLTQLAGEWNSFYAQERIIGSDEEGEKLRLVAAFVITMENGLSILGIPAPERM